MGTGVGQAGASAYHGEMPLPTRVWGGTFSKCQ